MKAKKTAEEKKLERIQRRRQEVFHTIKFRSGDTITLDEIVERTKFSRTEVTSHILVLTEEDKIGSDKDKKNFFHRLSQRERMESFNEFFHGCRNPIHVFGVGYLNPHDRYSKRFLDP